MSENCSLVQEGYDFWDYDNPHKNFPRCPICKAFISPYFPPDRPFTCKKCGTELMLFDYYEDGEKMAGMGKVCPTSINNQGRRST